MMVLPCLWRQQSRAEQAVQAGVTRERAGEKSPSIRCGQAGRTRCAVTGEKAGRAPVRTQHRRPFIYRRAAL